jgi:hypothetical protein
LADLSPQFDEADTDELIALLVEVMLARWEEELSGESSRPETKPQER